MAFALLPPVLCSSCLWFFSCCFCMLCICILLFDINLNSWSLVLPISFLVADGCRGWWAGFWVLQLLLSCLQVLAVISLIVLCLGYFRSWFFGLVVPCFDPAHIPLFWASLVCLLGHICLIYFISGLLDFLRVAGFIVMAISSWADLCFAVICLAVLFLKGLYFWTLSFGASQPVWTLGFLWLTIDKKKINSRLPPLIPSLFVCLLLRIVSFHLWSLIR